MLFENNHTLRRTRCASALGRKGTGTCGNDSEKLIHRQAYRKARLKYPFTTLLRTASQITTAVFGCSLSLKQYSYSIDQARLAM
jgi:hypothetical protein